MLTSITTTSAITAAFPALSPEKQKKADEVKQILQQTLDSLKNGKSDINAQRKAAAAARVAQIKQAIKTLRQVSGMDPKALARMVAMLAKQLASAVKDYKAAGGDDASVAAEVSAAPATASGSAEATADQDVATETVQPAETKTTFQQQSVAAYGKTQTVAAGNKSDKNEDTQFLRDATALLGEMKGLIEAQRQRIKNNKGISSNMDPDYRDVRSANKALDEVEATLQKIKAQTFSV